MVNKALLLASAAFVGTVLAQDGLPDLPPCATQCVTKFTTGGNIGDCPALNAQCICSSSEFLASIACCLTDVCGQADQAVAVDYAIKFCAAQGVQVPTVVECSSAASSTAVSSFAPSSTGGSSTAGTTTGSSSASTTGSPATPNTAATSQSSTGGAGSFATAAPQIVGGILAAMAIL